MKRKLPCLILITLTCLCLPALASPPHGLPPGLQKKAAQGNLPPGWQKKLRVGHHLQRDIYAHGYLLSPVDEHGYVTVQIEDRRLRVIAATLEIIDILN